jgi:hypothetical protein
MDAEVLLNFRHKKRRPRTSFFYLVGRGNLNSSTNLLIFIIKFTFLFSLEYQLEYPASVCMVWHVAFTALLLIYELG